MRGIAILVLGLAVAGCDHMYGGLDRGRIVGVSQPADAELVAIAARKLARERLSLTGLVPSVTDAGESWRVYFGPDEPKVLDGGVTVEINKKTRRAVRYWFDA